MPEVSKFSTPLYATIQYWVANARIGMSYFSPEDNGNQSRPMTPVLSNLAGGKVTQHSESPNRPPLKLITGNRPVVLQSREGPQILSLVNECLQKLASIDSKQSELERMIRDLQTSVRPESCNKPNCVPFQTYDGLKGYDKSSHEEQQQMKNYLLFFNGRNNPKDNTREILQHNRLMTDELLTQVAWRKKKDKKSSNSGLLKRRITHSLLEVLKEIYPTMTSTEFKEAIQGALRAACSEFESKKARREKKGAQYIIREKLMKMNISIIHGWSRIVAGRTIWIITNPKMKWKARKMEKVREEEEIIRIKRHYCF